jgi:thioredoxin-like negative regulator of GroEL
VTVGAPLRWLITGLAAAALSHAQEPAAPAEITPAPATADPTQDPVFRTRMYRALRQADEHAAKGQWGEAQAILLDLIEKAPQNLLLIEKTALLFTVQERWQPALDQWKQLFAKAQSRYDVLTRIGRCQALLGQNDEAAKNLLLASQLSPEPLEPRLWLAAVQQAQGQEARARETLGLPDLRETAYWLHLLADEAVHFRQVLGTPLYLDLVARVAAGGTDHPGFRLVTRPEAEWSDRLRGAARALTDLEQRMDGRESSRADLAWHAAKDLGLSGPLLQGYRAMILARTQGKEAGLAELTPWLAAHPGWVPLLHLHGVLLLETGAFAEAVPVLRDAAHRSGNRTDIAFALACALAGAGQDQEALILLDVLAGRDPGRLLRLLQMGAEALEGLRLRPEYSDLLDRLRAAGP